MAESKDQVLSVYKFPTLARGYDVAAPQRSMTPEAGGSLFRSMNNLTVVRGSLGSWFGLYNVDNFVSNTFTVENNGGYWDTTPDGLKNGQCPVFIFVDYPMSYPNSSTTSPTDFGSLMTICVTSREIYIYSPQDQTWYNATPVYATPAITVDVNGTTGVVTTTAAADANWSTYKIAPGQLIEFNADGNWYQITSVDSDTQLTTTYTGANLTADPYTIRRCFGGREYSVGENLIYCQVFNGNLFLGGRMLGGATAGPAVIKVSDIYDNVFTTDYILAGFDLTGGMSADGQVVADLWDIKGLKVLTDGRVVIATSEVPSGRTGVVGNRIRYSSNDETYQWVASPGGFSDIVDEGEIVALGQLDPNTLTVHFHRGIYTATFTGQDDPPLNYTRSSATAGTIAPRSIVRFGGREVFLGSDGSVHAFDGSSSTRLLGEQMEMISMSSGQGRLSCYRDATMLMANVHGALDHRRGFYRLFFNDDNQQGALQPTAVRCVCFVVDLVNSQLYREEYGAQITAAATPTIGVDRTGYEFIAGPGPTLTNKGGDFGDLVVGLPSWNPTASWASPDASENMLFVLTPYGFPSTAGIEVSASPFNYAIAPQGVYNPSSAIWDDTGLSVGFETDDLDFGLPGVDKTLDHVIIWVSVYNANSQPTNAVVQSSPDGGSTWYDAVPALDDAITSLVRDHPLMFDFAPKAAEAWRIRVRATDFSTIPATGKEALNFQFHRMNVYYQVQGEIEPVDPSLTS